MFLRILLFLIAMILIIIGMISIILYLNLFTIGYTFLEYVNFIISRASCMCLILGIILLIILIFSRRKNEIHI